MKKLNLIFIFLMFISFQSYAQITITPRVGTTFSTIGFSDELQNELFGSNNKSNVGIIGGVELGIGISDLFSIQTGVNYTQKGTKYEEGNESLSAGLNYIELPLLARVSFGSDKVKAYVNAGPSLGFALGGKFKGESDGLSFEEDITFGDGEDDAFSNSVDFGLQFGAGIGYAVGPGSIVLDLRYGLGLSNLFETPDNVDRSLLKSTNNVFAVSLGYAIPLGGN